MGRVAKQTSGLEQRYLHKHGDVVWTQHTSTLLHDAQGRPVYVMHHLQDSTARKVAEEQSAHLVALVEQPGDAMISKTLAGVITSWNRAATHLYGYTVTEAIGQPITLLAPPCPPLPGGG
jgi:PAS domain-containing protein